MKNTLLKTFGLIILLSFIVLPIKVHATKVLPGNFSTYDYSQRMIKQAEGKISEAEEKLSQIEEEGLENIVSRENFDVVNKNFKKITGYLEIAQENFVLAKKYFVEQDYYNVSSRASAAGELANISISYFSAILEDRITPEGIRVRAVEEKEPIDDKKEIIKVPIEGVKDIIEIFIKAPMEGIKEAIIISGEKIIIKDKDNKTEIIAPMEGIKFVTSIEHGEDKRDVIIVQGVDGTTIEITKKASSKDCDEYLKGCKAGNNTLCSKWDFNCKPPTQCEEYLKGCKLGDTELCKKWDLNCKSNFSQCDEYLRNCKLGDNEACKKRELNCDRKVVAKTKEILEIKENKIFINEKEVKIMPDTASEKAIRVLKLKKDVEIELKDTGKLLYEIIGEKEVKILGFIKAKMRIKIDVNAETGEIEKIKKPWWSFLAW